LPNAAILFSDLIDRLTYSTFPIHAMLIGSQSATQIQGL